MRFFIDISPKLGDKVTLDESEGHHLLNVYRAQMGETVKLFSTNGNCYTANLVSCKGHKPTLEILEQTHISVISNVEIILAQGVIKSQHWDLLLEKAMELGLDGLIPMTTQHLAVGKQTAGTPDRWKRVMISAAKQCGRNSLIAIQSQQTLTQILQKTEDIPLRILAHKSPKIPSILQILQNFAFPSNKKSSVLVMVGPEGGFHEDEIKMAQQCNVQMCTMGGYTLRAETAACALLAVLNAWFQDKRWSTTTDER